MQNLFMNAIDQNPSFHPLAVVLRCGPVFNHPKAVPEPIGLDLVVVVDCPDFPFESFWLACPSASNLPVALSAPLGVVAEVEMVLVAFAMVLAGRRIFMGRAALGRA